MKAIIYLESVGTYFRTSDNMTSPTKEFNEMETICVNNITNEEWFSQLSVEDLGTIKNAIDNKTIIKDE